MGRDNRRLAGSRHPHPPFRCERLPLPKPGDEVRALDRQGTFLCMAKVLKVHQAKKYDRTRVVTVSVEKRFCDEARGIEVVSNG